MGASFAVDDKVVLVTGGSRGLGLMMARGFVAAGATVYVTGRDGGVLDAVAASLSAEGPGTCTPLTAELGTEDGARRLAEELAACEPRLDVLVNNAGVTIAAPIEDHDDAIWDEVVAINLKGLFHVTRFLLPLLRAAAAERGPARVINIGSVSGIGISRRENFSYTATKAGVHHLTRQLALQLGPEVTVNTIAPGVIPTEMSTRMPSELLERVAADTPLQRTGTPEDLVGAAVFLASPSAAYLTGVEIPIDGGLSLRTLGGG